MHKGSFTKGLWVSGLGFQGFRLRFTGLRVSG